MFDNCTDKPILIPIPYDRISDYHSFLKMFNKEDSDESRNKFLNM